MFSIAFTAQFHKQFCSNKVHLKLRICDCKNRNLFYVIAILVAVVKRIARGSHMLGHVIVVAQQHMTLLSSSGSIYVQ